MQGIRAPDPGKGGLAARRGSRGGLPLPPPRTGEGEDLRRRRGRGKGAVGGGGEEPPPPGEMGTSSLLSRASSDGQRGGQGRTGSGHFCYLDKYALYYLISSIYHLTKQLTLNMCVHATYHHRI